MKNGKLINNNTINRTMLKKMNEEKIFILKQKIGLRNTTNYMKKAKLPSQWGLTSLLINYLKKRVVEFVNLRITKILQLMCKERIITEYFNFTVIIFQKSRLPVC